MSRKKSYSLIARNRNTQDLQIIDILGCNKCFLEDIDLFTTSFSNSYELASFLFSLGVVSDRDIDFFIINQKNRKDKKDVNISNVLFSDSKDIKKIANGFKSNNISSCEKDIESIFNSFCYKMEHNQKFYDFVCFGEHHLYSKFVKYFLGNRFQSFYYIKYRDGAWIMKSYYLIRNIYDCYSQYKNCQYPSITEDIYRKLLSQSLIRMADKDYNPRQLTLFEPFSYEEEKSLKTISIIDTLDNLSSYGDFEFLSFLKMCKEKFNISEEFIELLCSYCLNRIYFMDFLENGEDIRFYKDRINMNQKRIIDLLKKNEKLLDSAYNIYLLYNDNKNYQEGEENGFQYCREKKD